MNDVAGWAIKNRRWQPQRRSLVRELSRHLSRTANADRHDDPQGRKDVRTYHAARVEKPNDSGQMIIEVVWDHLNEMSLHHAQVSFNQRYDQIIGACQSLNNDMASCNDNNPNVAKSPIQKTFDFTTVVEPQQEQITEEIPRVAPKKAK
jgi:hypothetical protein